PAPGSAKRLAIAGGSRRVLPWRVNRLVRLDSAQTSIPRTPPRVVLGAILSPACGPLLWQMTLGGSWVGASYDYLFRLGSRPITNQVVLILMDNDAHEKLKETRGQWSRQRHAQLLNKLADDGCPLVVFDVLLREPKDPGQDARLAEAMQRLPNVALL